MGKSLLGFLHPRSYFVNSLRIWNWPETLPLPHVSFFLDASAVLINQESADLTSIFCSSEVASSIAHKFVERKQFDIFGRFIMTL